MRARAAAALFPYLFALLLASAAHAESPEPDAKATSAAGQFSVDPEAGKPLMFIVYGDMRFTASSETVASSPGARRALVAKVAAEKPDALFLTGDIPWHGSDRADYRVYQQETAAWQDEHLKVFALLGNHEFMGCDDAVVCLENWWQAFPAFRGMRWYSVALGTEVRVLALDSDASLLPGSEQRSWLERQIKTLPPEVKFVILALHHPPMADESLLITRHNERSLAGYLRALAPKSSVRFVVCAAHVHNYEHFERGGVTFLVSGGGGAKPLVVHRTPYDHYRVKGFPNYNYLRFELQGDRLSVQMFRLEDYDAPAPQTWTVNERFDVVAKPH
jgi:3',5'-cyclic AMP phosphodiesterase CpdA